MLVYACFDVRTYVTAITVNPGSLEPVDLSVARYFHISDGGFTTLQEEWNGNDNEALVEGYTAVRPYVF